MHDKLKPSKFKLVLDIIKTFSGVLMRHLNPFHKTSEQDRMDMMKVQTCINILKNKKSKLVEEIEKHFEQPKSFKETTLDILADPELKNHCHSLGEMRDYLKKTGKEDVLKKALRDKLNPKEIISEAMDAFHEDLKRNLVKELNKQVEKGLIRPFPVPESLGHTGQIVKFDDLPVSLQEELKQHLPVSLLRSNKCEIRKDGSKISVVIVR
jgi:flagellar biosynthesis component FlhA